MVYYIFSVVFALIVVVTCAPDALRSGLNTLAKQNHKLYFGTATNNAEFINDTSYRNIIRDVRMFGQVTPAHGMKWVRNFFIFKQHILTRTVVWSWTKSRPIRLCSCRSIRAVRTQQWTNNSRYLSLIYWLLEFKTKNGTKFRTQLCLAPACSWLGR